MYKRQGGTVISEEVGLELKDADMTMLGRAGSVKVTKENTVIVNGAGSASDIEERVALIRRQIEDTTSEFDREKLEERLAKLAGGVAVIQVGAATETELKERKLRMEDALNATRAAVEEGIVSGGGVALIETISEVEKLLTVENTEIKTGIKIILSALQEPLKQIAINAGLEGAVIVENVRKGEKGMGFDAFREEYVNMIEAGIIDPTKVTRSALQNASSVAATFLTTEAAVVDIKSEEPAMPPMGGGMPMM